MSGVKSGKYSLVEPGSGVTVFSMEGGEVNLFGSYTNIITTGVDTYPSIDDNLISKKAEDKTQQMLDEGLAKSFLLTLLGGVAIAAAPFISIAAVGLGVAVLGVMCVTAGLKSKEYTMDTVRSDRISGHDTDWEDFRKGFNNSAWEGAKSGAQAFKYVLDGLSAIQGFIGGFMGPSSPGEVLAGAGGETVPVPEIIVNDAGMSALFSASLPDGPFGKKKEQEEKEGVYIEDDIESDSIKISEEKMYQLGNHYNKHGRDMGYVSKKEYEQAARIFFEKNLNKAEIFEGTYNSGHGKNVGARQIIVRYNGKQLVINKESGQIVDFYEGTSLDSFIKVERIQ